MVKHNKSLVIFSALLVFLVSGCQFDKQMLSEKPIITVSIVPQQFFVDRLAGDYFDVNVMVQPGQSPENYEPTPAQMVSVSSSRAYILIGAPFEKVWVDKVKAANSQLLFFDSSQGIERISMTEHHHDQSGEALSATPAAQEADPHIWTSPALVKIQVQNISQFLQEIDPAHAEEYKGNLASFLAEIDQLDQEIQTLLAPVTQRQFMVYHPTWGYFAEQYGFTQIAVEGGGTEPSAQELAAIIDEARLDQVRVIIVQPEFSQRSAETIAREIGGSVVAISSLEYDWFATMRFLTSTLAKPSN